MDETIFRKPEPEDHDLPPYPPAGREDNAIPGADPIGQASPMFNFPGGTTSAGGAYPEPPTRQVGTSPYYSPGAPVPPAGGGAPGNAAEPPVPPFMQREDPYEPRQVPAQSSQMPMQTPQDVLPEKPGKPRPEKGGKKRWVLLACGLTVIAVAAGVVLYFLLWGNPFPGNEGGIKVPSSMPQTEEEVVDFYRIAVNAVKKDGLAGYSKKAWQSASALNLTGIEFVDNLLGNIFEEYVHPEDRAETLTYEKGTAEAKEQFPPFTLEDLSHIKSAECVREGDLYQITIVFRHEDTPKQADSFLGQATNAVIFWDTKIEPILKVIPQLQEWSDVHMDYVDVTITAQIDTEGHFVSLKHVAPAEVSIGFAKLSIFKFRDKSLSFESTVTYSDFVYEGE